MPMIRNYLTTSKQSQDNSHGGSGPVDLYEIWEKSDFRSNVDFVDRVVIPPGSAIGFHKHDNNEEMYIVLKGRGLMKIENEEVVVKEGDMILNPVEGQHGLTNNSEKDIDVLVIQVSINE